MSSKKKKAYTEISRSPNKTMRNLDPSGIYERAGTWLLILSEQLAWYYNCRYEGHTLKMGQRGWFLIIRADFNGKKMVSFAAGDSPTECVRHMAYDMRNGRSVWKKDRFAK